MYTCNGPVLIVEDDHNTATLVKTYLEREGFSTVTAADGEMALRLAREKNLYSYHSSPLKQSLTPFLYLIVTKALSCLYIRSILFK